MSKQLVTVRFGEQEQQKGTKLRIPGQVANAQDVYQTKTGVYQQRKGFASKDRNTDTGSITSAKGLATLANQTLILQTADTVFARTETATKWINKGAYSQAMMTWAEAIPALGVRPTSVSTGGQTWTFVYNYADNFWYYVVSDDATAVVVQPLTKAAGLTDAGGGTGWGRPVVAGGFIWFFFAVPTALLKVAKFTPSTPAAAPTVTTYYNHTTAIGGTLVSFDVMTTASNPLVVTFGSGNTGISQLDPTTGLPAAGGTPGSLAYQGPGCILRGGDGSNGSFYVMAGTSVQLLTIDASALTVTTHDDLSGVLSITSTGIWSGYWDGTNKVVFRTEFAPGGSVDVENATITRVVKPSGAATAANYARARYQVSPPFKVGSSWYVVTGHDDNHNLQRSYYLQDAGTGKILARDLYQLGGDICGRGGFTSGIGGFDYNWVSSDPVISGTNAVVPLIVNMLGTADFQTCSITIETSPSLGPLASLSSGDKVLATGGWPAQVSAADALLEQSPMMYPRAIVSIATNGANWTAGTYGFAILYAFIDAAGNITRSSPSPTVTQAIGGAQGPKLTVPTLRVTNGAAGTAYIEIYATLAGGLDLFLVKTIANDPTVDSILVSSISQTYGELIYTSGNVLSNSPPPPHRVSFTWRNRQIVTDTDVPGETWYSKEFELGMGLAYSDTMVVRIPGRVRAGGVVDENYAALFQQSAIWLLYGQGMSDAGSGGNFSTLKLDWAMGCTNPASVVTGPQGCFFQGTDGGIYMVVPGGGVTYVGAGVDDYKAATVTAAVHVFAQRQMRFFLNNGKCLVLDYGNTESNPLGKWYVFTNNSAVSAVANTVPRFVDSTGVVWVEAGITSDGPNVTPILPKIQMATISFAGILGHARVYRGQVLGTFKGQHTIQVTATPDFTGASQVWSKALSAAPEQVEFRPDQQRCTALDITIERIGTDLTDSFTFEGLAFEIGVKPGMRRVNVGQQF